MTQMTAAKFLCPFAYSSVLKMRHVRIVLPAAAAAAASAVPWRQPAAARAAAAATRPPSVDSVGPDPSTLHNKQAQLWAWCVTPLPSAFAPRVWHCGRDVREHGLSSTAHDDSPSLSLYTQNMLERNTANAQSMHFDKATLSEHRTC